MGSTVRVLRPSIRGSPPRICRARSSIPAQRSFLDRVGVRDAFRPDTELGEDPLPDLVDRLGARAFCLSWNASRRSFSASSAMARGQRLVTRLGRPVPFLGAGIFHHFIDGLYHLLHLLVPEHHRPKHDVLGHSFASDSTMSTACSVRRPRGRALTSSLGGGGIEHVLPVEVADACRADRPAAVCPTARALPTPRLIAGMSESILAVRRHHGGDDLYLVIVAVRNTAGGWGGRSAGRSDLLSGRAAFTAEEPAGICQRRRCAPVSPTVSGRKSLPVTAASATTVTSTTESSCLP